MISSKAAIAVVALVVGFIGGVAGGTVLGGGTMAGAGAAAGIATGICTTVRAARELEYLTPTQVDTVLAKAATDAGGDESEITKSAIGSAEACDKFIESARDQ